MKSIFIVLIILLGFFWVVAPLPMKDKVIGLITFASSDRQCFNYYKNEDNFFKDPDSAYIKSSRILTKKDNKGDLSQYPVVLRWEKYDSVVQIEVFARNSMGGYVLENIYCPLINNKFNKFEQSQYALEVSFHASCQKYQTALLKPSTTTQQNFKVHCSEEYPNEFR